LIYVHDVFATRFFGPKAEVRQYWQGTGGDRYLMANRPSEAAGHPPGPRRPERANIRCYLSAHIADESVVADEPG
jgi:hypothetical protein